MKLSLAILLAASLAHADGGAPPPANGKPQPTVLTTQEVCPTKDAAADKSYTDANEAADAHDTQKAEKLYLDAIAKDPKFCDAMDNLGLLYRHNNRVDEAIALFKRAIQVAPTDKTAFMDLAVALRVQKKLDEALATYQSLEKLDSIDPEGWFGAGSVFEQQGKFAEAIAPLEQARKLYSVTAPDLVDDATTLLGMAYGETANWPKTIECLEAVYPHYGADGYVNLYLGRAYIAQNDKAKAKTYLQRAAADGVPVTSDEKKAVGGL